MKRGDLRLLDVELPLQLPPPAPIGVVDPNLCPMAIELVVELPERMADRVLHEPLQLGTLATHGGELLLAVSPDREEAQYFILGCLLLRIRSHLQAEIV